MYIISQSGETLVNMENMSALYVDIQESYIKRPPEVVDVYYLKAREGDCICRLGEFRSYEAAQKIFREIVKTIAIGNPTYRVPQEDKV
ncbi:MAG: hypothetical protein [Bacteriophage sp.]|nr:MAG: hypothetical protein [Bacteriophage sp.]